MDSTRLMIETNAIYFYLGTYWRLLIFDHVLWRWWSSHHYDQASRRYFKLYIFLSRHPKAIFFLASLPPCGHACWNALASRGPFFSHYLDMGVSKNRVFCSQIIHFKRVFHYFYHPFWGTPFLETPILDSDEFHFDRGPLCRVGWHPTVWWVLGRLGRTPFQ